MPESVVPPSLDSPCDERPHQRQRVEPLQADSTRAGQGSIDQAAEVDPTPLLSIAPELLEKFLDLCDGKSVAALSVTCRVLNDKCLGIAPALYRRRYNVDWDKDILSDGAANAVGALGRHIRLLRRINKIVEEIVDEAQLDYFLESSDDERPKRHKYATEEAFLTADRSYVYHRDVTITAFLRKNDNWPVMELFARVHPRSEECGFPQHAVIDQNQLFVGGAQRARLAMMRAGSLAGRVPADFCRPFWTKPGPSGLFDVAVVFASSPSDLAEDDNEKERAAHSTGNSGSSVEEERSAHTSDSGSSGSSDDDEAVSSDDDERRAEIAEDGSPVPPADDLGDAKDSDIREDTEGAEESDSESPDASQDVSEGVENHAGSVSAVYDALRLFAWVWQPASLDAFKFVVAV
eukprot:TRINITY_DN31955_c0_g1_i1.p1 TRINITY_DN31955_c0_g1~~TRINITY_DN31955_c0_g1_i1.p1  ORF type:complete len:406 (-),score=112.43 TRINITY_DN31955_c0_g1_i1:178-1395(-)